MALRAVGERRKEHLKQPSPIHGHSQATGHPIDNNKFNFIGREDKGQASTIKESIYMWVNNPTLTKILVSTTSIIYGTEFFLIPQGLNWALPNTQLLYSSLISIRPT